MQVKEFFWDWSFAENPFTGTFPPSHADAQGPGDLPAFPGAPGHFAEVRPLGPKPPGFRWVSVGFEGRKRKRSGLPGGKMTCFEMLLFCMVVLWRVVGNCFGMYKQKAMKESKLVGLGFFGCFDEFHDLRKAFHMAFSLPDNKKTTKNQSKIVKKY